MTDYLKNVSFRELGGDNGDIYVKYNIGFYEHSGVFPESIIRGDEGKGMLQVYVVDTNHPRCLALVIPMKKRFEGDRASMVPVRLIDIVSVKDEAVDID